MAALGPAAAPWRASSVWSITSRTMLAFRSQPQHASPPKFQPAQTSQIAPSCTRTSGVPIPQVLLQQQRARFSTSPVLEKRRKKYHPRDNNRLRGVSSIRRSGPRQFLSVSDSPLPRPALTDTARAAAAAASRPEIDPDHGLWQFFYENKQVAQSPTLDAAFGRAWTVEELRRKSWEDLHRLWWVCVKERNRIATTTAARKFYELGYGNYEAKERDAAVRKTMRGIKHALTERFYVWEDAVELAQTDPEIDLSGEGPAFRPAGYFEEEPAAAALEEGGEAAAAQSADAAAAPKATASEQEPVPAR